MAPGPSWSQPPSAHCWFVGKAAVHLGTHVACPAPSHVFPSSPPLLTAWAECGCWARWRVAFSSGHGAGEADCPIHTTHLWPTGCPHRPVGLMMWEMPPPLPTLPVCISSSQLGDEWVGMGHAPAMVSFLLPPNPLLLHRPVSPMMVTAARWRDAPPSWQQLAALIFIACPPAFQSACQWL